MLRTMLSVVRSCKGLSPAGSVSWSARLAVLGDNRFSVSLLTPDIRQTCANDQSLSW